MRGAPEEGAEGAQGAEAPPPLPARWLVTGGCGFGVQAGSVGRGLLRG